jgi:UDP-N-acetylglucosamine--N-acetylmuramyl-(pentapeptide) pyrophosphoryl-undecaprenol N-acetylglucosamine transferase
MQQPEIKILISGGGTGGHIFPAIAIADAIRRKSGRADILFVGAKGRMEMDKVPMAGYPIEGLWISGFQRNFTLKNLLFPLKLAVSLIESGKIINRFKPDVVVGVGGYASGAICKMAVKKHIPVVLQEQNSFPGITNKLLAKDAAKICVAYDGMERYFPVEKLIKTGNPVRKNMIDVAGKRNQAFEFFKLEKSKPVVFIVGGSQGAKAINECIDENLGLFVRNNLQLIWQTGKFYIERAKSAISEKIEAGSQKSILAVEFIERMDLAYAAADIVVSRAGAIAISELCAVGKPCIFVPLPTAAEDHQTKNALALVGKQAAIHLPNHEVSQKLGGLVLDLAKNESKRTELSTNIQKLAVSNSDDIIADEIIKIAVK